MKYCSTNADILIKILKHMFEKLKEQGINLNETGIIMNNCAFHRTGCVKDYWKSVRVSRYYLPAYWPY